MLTLVCLIYIILYDEKLPSYLIIKNYKYFAFRKKKKFKKKKENEKLGTIVTICDKKGNV